MFNEYQINVASIQELVMVDHTLVDDTLAIIGTSEKINFAPDQATLSIGVDRSDSGVVFKYSLTASIPRVQYAIKQAAEVMYKRFVFFITDNNGTKYVIGRKNKGYQINIAGEVSENINTIVFGFEAVSSQSFELTEI